MGIVSDNTRNADNNVTSLRLTYFLINYITTGSIHYGLMSLNKSYLSIYPVLESIQYMSGMWERVCLHSYIFLPMDLLSFPVPRATVVSQWCK